MGSSLPTSRLHCAGVYVNSGMDKHELWFCAGMMKELLR